MNKNNGNKRTIALFATLCIAIAVFCVGVTTAWFKTSKDTYTTITLKNGIQLEIAGLANGGAVNSEGQFTLNLSNNTDIAPGAEIPVDNVYVKIKEGVNSSDVFLRYKISYQYKDIGSDGSEIWCYFLPHEHGIKTGLTGNTSDGFYSIGGYQTCLKSKSYSFDNLKTVSTSPVKVFANTPGFDKPTIVMDDELTENLEFRIFIKFEAVQNTVKAAEAVWGDDAMKKLLYLDKREVDSIEQGYEEIYYDLNTTASDAVLNFTSSTGEVYTDANTCGLYTDKDLTISYKGETLESGAVLFTASATLDKITFGTVSNGYIPVSAKETATGEVVIPKTDSNGVSTIVGSFSGKTLITSVVASGVKNFSAYSFYNCNALESIIFSDNLKPSGYLNYAFSKCSSLKKVNVDNWDTSAVTSMGQMFEGCSSLTELDVSNWDTSAVTSMNSMFRGCSSLTEIDVSNWDTSNAYSNLSYMFSETKIKSIDISNFNISGTAEIDGMFAYCEYLESIDLSMLTFNRQLSASSLFAYCFSLNDMKLPTSTMYILDSCNMFFCCYSLAEIDVSTLNMSSNTSMEAMFGGCRSLTSLDLSSWDTSTVETMMEMFAGCSALTDLNLGKWETDTVTDLSFMFDGCKSLTEISIASFTSLAKVTMMDCMFYDCRSLTKFKFPTAFDYSSVQYMNSMFYNCENLEGIIDLESCDLTSIESMSYMFYGCTKVENVYLPTSMPELSDTSYMFYGCTSLKKMEWYSEGCEYMWNMSYMFYGCTSMSYADLEINSQSQSIKKLDSMFEGCTSIDDITIHLSTENGPSANKMFKNCTVLETVIGASGFSFSQLSSCTEIFAGTENSPTINTGGIDVQWFESLSETDRGTAVYEY